MTISRTQAILLGIALTLVAVASFYGGTHCGPSYVTVEPIVTGIDAGPGEAAINARLDGALRASEAHIVQIEEKFDEDIAAFDARQRGEYAQLRNGENLDAAAMYLSEWSRNRSRAAPR